MAAGHRAHTQEGPSTPARARAVLILQLLFLEPGLAVSCSLCLLRSSSMLPGHIFSPSSPGGAGSLWSQTDAPGWYPLPRQPTGRLLAPLWHSVILRFYDLGLGETLVFAAQSTAGVSSSRRYS